MYGETLTKVGENQFLESTLHLTITHIQIFSSFAVVGHCKGVKSILILKVETPAFLLLQCNNKHLMWLTILNIEI